MTKKWLSRHDNGCHFRVYDAGQRPGPKKWKAPPMPGVRKRVLDIAIEKLEPREKRPVDVESRVNWFIEQYKSGHPWAPIWVFKSGDKYIVYDGNARLRAAKALGLKSLQATVMSSAQKRRLLEQLRVAPKI
jgi:ParB-like chromosome segregation protein Spo0J